MENLKLYINKLKPWLILSTYIIILLLIILNFSYLSKTFSQYLGLLKPFFYSIGIAYVLNIPMKKIEASLKKIIKDDKSFLGRKIRAISITLTVIFSLVIISLFALFILPQLFSSIGSLISNITNFLNGLAGNLTSILEFFNVDVPGFDFSQAGIENFLKEFGLSWKQIVETATSWITGAGFTAWDIVINFAAELTNWFVGFMLSLYLLSSKEAFIRQIKKVVAVILPFKRAKTFLKYGTITNGIFTNFVGGQLVEAFIIGILIYIMMFVTGIPYAILISSIVAIFALVPVFGAMIAMVLGFVLIFSQDPIQAIWFVVLFQVVQTFENNVIYPKVVGESVGLPGIWTLLSIILFGGMYGVVGMLIAVPLTACAYQIGSDYLNHHLNKKNITVTTEDIQQVEVEKQ